VETVGLVEIFLIVLFSSLFSIGGVGGMTALIQDRWVGHGLLDSGLFSWLVALSYMSPGRNAVSSLPLATICTACLARAQRRRVSFSRRVLAPLEFLMRWRECNRR
jgi:chromate transport protein ChrA